VTLPMTVTVLSAMVWDSYPAAAGWA
jgi:hypothetical protein